MGDAVQRINLAELDESGDVRGLAEECGALDPTGHTRRDLVQKGVLGGFGAGIAMFGLLDPMEALAAASAKQKGKYSTSLRKVNRRAKSPTPNDVVIANYALTLEYIEAAFYALAVQKNYEDKDIAAAAKVLADHEQAHVDALKRVLGKAAVRPPKFNMEGVEALLKDQETFIQSAAAIEPVGTAAYAGAGPYLSNLAVTKAALAIHSVEANHASYTQAIVVAKGLNSKSPVPNAFNPALGFNAVVAEVGKLNVVDGPLQP
jgi:rubrerythrin